MPSRMVNHSGIDALGLKLALFELITMAKISPMALIVVFTRLLSNFLLFH